MEAKKLTEELKKLTDSGVKNKTLEEQIGLPKNSLSNVLSGRKEMPGKWIEKIQKYFAAKDSKGTKSTEPEYEIAPTDKNWTTELMEEMERLKKENAELRPDAMAWRSRMQNMGVDLAGQKTTLTVSQAIASYKESRQKAKDAKVEMYEPEEGTNAHFMRYGAFRKSEIKK